MRLSDERVFNIIRERRKKSALNTDGPDDLLGMLLAARDEETGESLIDQELRDEVTTFIGAGNETTAVTLAWTWYLLSKHPDVERKLHAELDQVLGGRMPTAQDVPNLPYTRMIIEETMRLYPAAWAIGRGIESDDEIGGYQIKKGAMMMVVSPYVTHRRPDIWDNPEGFEPERFTRTGGRTSTLRLLPVWRWPASMYWQYLCPDGSPACLSNGRPKISAALDSLLYG